MFTFLLSASLLAPTADPAQYARPDLLVEAADVSANKFTILDTRAKDKYADGHISSAVNVAIGPWAKAVNDGKADAAFWKSILATIGVGPKTPVLVYSDDLRESARGWWLLKLSGVPDARLLNGGWDAYKTAKGEVNKEIVTPKFAVPHD